MPTENGFGYTRHMPGPISQDPGRAERRELARARHPETVPNANAVPARRCAFCLGPVEPGEVVCSPAREDRAWALCPTISGELWTN